MLHSWLKGRYQGNLDESDFGLDEESYMLAENGTYAARTKYGAAEGDQASRWADRATSFWQKCAVFLCVAFLISNSIRRMSAPSEGHADVQIACDAYTYPQCENAIIHYLEHGAQHRCEAFERVKAEGDYFKFPNSAHKKAHCIKAGCCSCPGQCSQCPPVLPECISWRLDGEWKVAFNDGSLAKYTFDAKGHVEEELPPKLIPRAKRPSGSGKRRVAAIAGSVSPADTTGHVFRLDLNSAAPAIFPPGAFELLTMVNGELRVRREIESLSSAQAIGVGSRVDAHYHRSWDAGTVVKGPADDPDKLGRWAVQCDNDRYGLITYTKRVRHEDVTPAIDGIGVKVTHRR